MKIYVPTFCLLLLLFTTALAEPDAKTGSLVGPWNMRISLRSGESAQYTMAIRADGTWSYDRGFSGTWAVAGDQLVVLFSGHPDMCDHYLLPAAGGELRGKNAEGQELVLSRKKSS